MSRQDVKDEDEIDFGRWAKASKLALKILFPNERQLCARVFLGLSSAADFSFMEVCKESVHQLLNFTEAVTRGRRSPKQLFKTLNVFETLGELIPEYESLFCDQYSVSLMNEANKILKRLGE